MLEPEKSCTVTPGRSPASVPARPVTVSDMLAVELPVAGEVRVTLGGIVSTVKVKGTVSPVWLPGSELSWLTTSVYVPFGSAGLIGPEVHAPPVPDTVALAQG